MERFEQALTRLRQMIEAPSLGNGRLPPERQLAGELGVGRRGMFLRYDAENGGPAIDAIIEHTNPIEVMEVRLSIEPMLARLASLRASKCDLDHLSRLAEETRTATTPEAYTTADAAFHRRIAQAARNSLSLALYDSLSAISRDTAWRRLGENGACYKSQARYARHHAEIAEAIIARDGSRAQDAMYNHLREVQRDVLGSAFPER
jgi:DNA-binding FadR family transcriptional regulator